MKKHLPKILIAVAALVVIGLGYKWYKNRNQAGAEIAEAPNEKPVVNVEAEDLAKNDKVVTVPANKN